MIQSLKNRVVFYGLGGFALLLLASPVRNSFAFTSNDLSNGLVNGGSVWLESTIVVALAFVSAMAFSLQIARGYFVRVLNKFTLRLGADIWWLAYVLIRDGLIFMSFIMGLLVFFPGTFLDYPMAVPFMPISVVFFGAALVSKLYVDADDNRNAFRFVTILVFIGTLLWITGTIFVTESPLQLATLPPGVSATTGFWYMMSQTFSSQTNLPLTMASFEACFAALGIIGVFGFAHPILHSRLPARRKPIIGAASTPQPSTAPVVPTARAVVNRGNARDTSSSFTQLGSNSEAKMDQLSPDALKGGKPDYIG